MILSTGLERQLFFSLKKKSFVQNAIFTLSFDQHLHFYTIYFGYRYTVAKRLCEPPLHTAHSLAYNVTAVYGEL